MVAGNHLRHEVQPVGMDYHGHLIHTGGFVEGLDGMLNNHAALEG
jgi:hypothetical protein